jgi:hypothetical protein
MLNRMMGAAGDGLHDRLMEFTTPASGLDTLHEKALNIGL